MSGAIERVVDRALHRDPPELLHEVLLALDPPDVGGGVERAPPLPGGGVVLALGVEDLEVPGPDPLQRGRAVELVAARAVGRRPAGEHVAGDARGRTPAPCRSRSTMPSKVSKLTSR